MNADNFVPWKLCRKEVASEKKNFKVLVITSEMSKLPDYGLPTGNSSLYTVKFWDDII